MSKKGSLNNKTIELLYPLRGLLAIGIIFYHLRDKPFGFESVFFHNLYYCVDVFFIISGLVISQNYHGKIKTKKSLAGFLIKRLGRIYPLHLFMLMVWVPYILIKTAIHNYYGIGTNPIETSNIGSFISNLLLMHSLSVHDYLGWNFPSWSISVEFYVYVLFGLIILLLHRITVLLSIVTVAGSYLVLYMIDKPNFDITYDFGVFRCLGGFFLGFLIYRLRPYLKVQETQKALLISISFILLIASLTYEHVRFSHSMMTIFCSSLLIYFISSYHCKNLSQPLKNFGDVSYSIYMVHLIVVEVVSQAYILSIENMIEENVVVKTMVCVIVVAISLFISKYTYSFIERPAREKLYRYANQTQFGK